MAFSGWEQSDDEEALIATPRAKDQTEGLPFLLELPSHLGQELGEPQTLLEIVAPF